VQLVGLYTYCKMMHGAYNAKWDRMFTKQGSVQVPALYLTRVFSINLYLILYTYSVHFNASSFNCGSAAQRRPWQALGRYLGF
jgi:hypothetical protein